VSDAVEVAIKKAFCSRVSAFAITQGLAASYPNVEFATPAPSKTTQWLRVAFLPASLYPIALGFTDNNQYFGLCQIDAVQGQGIGELAPSRLASLIIAYFARGTQMISDGFTIDILAPPFCGPMMKDDPWVFVPVRVPYNCFATPA